MFDERFGADFLAHYTVLDELGRGASGTVYLALQKSLNRKVAVKYCNSNGPDGKSFSERFRREARLLTQMNHPNVIQIYDHGFDGDTPYLVEELMEGNDLADEIEKVSLFEVSEAANIILQAAAGLEAAHGKRILHRDLKPDNIFLNSDGVVKVLDFGLARHIEDHTQLTKTGYIVGTPLFMAPEQLRGETLDERTDVFSLGFILYNMLTGDMPFSCENTGLLMRINGKAPSLAEKSERVLPPKLVEFVDSCLDRLPQKRPPNMSEFSKRLGPFAQSKAREFKKTQAQEPVRPPLVTAVYVKQKTKDRRSIFAYLISCMVIVIGILTLLVKEEPKLLKICFEAVAKSQSATITWRTEQALKYDYRVLSEEQKTLLRSSEKTPKTSHCVIIRGLQPDRRYRLHVSHDGVAYQYTFRTNKISFSRAPFVAIHRKVAYLDFASNVDGYSIFQLKGADGDEVVRKCSMTNTTVFIHQLPRRAKSNFTWVLKYDNVVIAKGEVPPGLAAKKGLGKTYLEKGKLKVPFLTIDPVVARERIFVAQRNGPLSCYDNGYKLRFAYSAINITKQFAWRGVAGVTLLDDDRVLLSWSEDPHHLMTIRCLDIPAREKMWESKSNSGNRAQSLISGNDSQWNDAISGREWSVRNGPKTISIGNAVTSDELVGILASDLDASMNLYVFDLENKKIKWNYKLPSNGNSYWIGSSPLRLINGRVMTLLRTESSDPSRILPFGFFSCPLSKHIPTSDDVTFFRYEHLAFMQDFACNGNDVWLTGQRNLFRFTYGGKRTQHRDYLVVPQDERGYLSGPTVASNGLLYGVYVDARISSIVPPGCPINLVTWRQGEPLKIVEPHLFLTAAEESSFVLHRLTLVGDWIVGCSENELFVIDVKTGKFGYWQHIDWFRGFCIDSRGMVVVGTKTGDLAIIPPALLLETSQKRLQL